MGIKNKITVRSNPIDISYFKGSIGKKVAKLASGKPFKSGYKVNTVKDVVTHPFLGVPAFTFEEDDSFVECRRCFLV